MLCNLSSQSAVKKSNNSSSSIQTLLYTQCVATSDKEKPLQLNQFFFSCFNCSESPLAWYLSYWPPTSLPMPSRAPLFWGDNRISASLNKASGPDGVDIFVLVIIYTVWVLQKFLPWRKAILGKIYAKDDVEHTKQLGGTLVSCFSFGNDTTLCCW